MASRWQIVVQHAGDEPRPLLRPFATREAAVAEVLAILEGFRWPTITITGDAAIGWVTEGQYDGRPMDYRYWIETREGAA